MTNLADVPVRCDVALLRPGPESADRRCSHQRSGQHEHVAFHDPREKANPHRDMGESSGAQTQKHSSCEGGALPLLKSIAGPRETHDYRNCDLRVPDPKSSSKIKK